MTKECLTAAESKELVRLLAKVGQYEPRDRTLVKGEERRRRDDLTRTVNKEKRRHRRKVEITRVMVWPEYAFVQDGEIFIHIERQYTRIRHARKGARPPRWKLLVGARRAQRRLQLRINALRSLDENIFQRALVLNCESGRSERARRAYLRLIGEHVSFEEDVAPETFVHAEKSTIEITGWCVQVAAKVQGSLYIDTLHAAGPHDSDTHHTTQLVQCFTEWLALLGCPLGPIEQIEALEKNSLAQERFYDEQQIASLLTHLIGALAQDVAFSALEKAFRSQLDHNKKQVDHQASILTLGEFGQGNYDQLKDTLLDRACSSDTQETGPALLSRLSRLIIVEDIDLQEVFLDTPSRAGRVSPEFRVAYPELRRGIARLLACLPVIALQEPLSSSKYDTATTSTTSSNPSDEMIRRVSYQHHERHGITSDDTGLTETLTQDDNLCGCSSSSAPPIFY